MSKWVIAEYANNGRIEIKKRTENGEHFAFVTSYDTSGRKTSIMYTVYDEEVGDYVDHGTYTGYDNGKIFVKQTHEYGKLINSIEYKNGKKFLEEIYNDDEEVIRRVEYKNGRKSKTIDLTRKKKKTHYSEDEPKDYSVRVRTSDENRNKGPQ